MGVSGMDVMQLKESMEWPALHWRSLGSGGALCTLSSVSEQTGKSELAALSAPTCYAPWWQWLPCSHCLLLSSSSHCVDSPKTPSGPAALRHLPGRCMMQRRLQRAHH